MLSCGTFYGEVSKFRNLTGVLPSTSYSAIPSIRLSKARILCNPTKAVAMSESTIKIYDANTLTPQQLKDITARPRIDFTSILTTVGDFTFSKKGI